MVRTSDPCTEGHGFDSRRGLIIFSLSHARDTLNIPSFLTFRLFEEHFLLENEPKKPRNILGTEKSFRTILEKQTPAYSLGALFLALAKFIYYTTNVVSHLNHFFLGQLPCRVTFEVLSICPRSDF